MRSFFFTTKFSLGRRASLRDCLSHEFLLMNFRTSLQLFFVACLMISYVEASAQIRVRPTKLIVSPDSKAETILIVSDGSTVRRFEVTVVAWQQVVEAEKITPSDALIVSPPAFTLKPNLPQVLRVLRVGPPDAQIEQSFRLLINEITTQPSGPATGTPTVSLNMSLPVFVSPLSSAAEAFDLELSPFQKSADGKSSRMLKLSNRGRVHVQGSQVMRLRAGAEFGEPIPLFGYALPGRTRTWTLDAEGLIGADALRVRVTSGATTDLSL